MDPQWAETDPHSKVRKAMSESTHIGIGVESFEIPAVSGLESRF